MSSKFKISFWLLYLTIWFSLSATESFITREKSMNNVGQLSRGPLPVQHYQPDSNTNNRVNQITNSQQPVRQHTGYHRAMQGNNNYQQMQQQRPLNNQNNQKHINRHQLSPNNNYNNLQRLLNQQNQYIQDLNRQIEQLNVKLQQTNQQYAQQRPTQQFKAVPCKQCQNSKPVTAPVTKPCPCGSRRQLTHNNVKYNQEQSTTPCAICNRYGNPMQIVYPTIPNFAKSAPTATSASTVISKIPQQTIYPSTYHFLPIHPFAPIPIISPTFLMPWVPATSISSTAPAPPTGIPFQSPGTPVTKHYGKFIPATPNSKLHVISPVDSSVHPAPAIKNYPTKSTVSASIKPGPSVLSVHPIQRVPTKIKPKTTIVANAASKRESPVPNTNLPVKNMLPVVKVSAHKSANKKLSVPVDIPAPKITTAPANIASTEIIKAPKAKVPATTKSNTSINTSAPKITPAPKNAASKPKTPLLNTKSPMKIELPIVKVSVNKLANAKVPPNTSAPKTNSAPANVTIPETITAPSAKVQENTRNNKSINIFAPKITPAPENSASKPMSPLPNTKSSVKNVLPAVNVSTNKTANTTVAANTPGHKNTTVSINITNPEIIPAPTSKVPTTLKSHKSKNVQSAVQDSANTTVPAITPGPKQTPAPANITNPEIILASTSKVPTTLKSHKSETVLPIIKDSANKSANTTVHANTPGPKNTTVSINITNPEIIPAPTSKVPTKLKSHKSENVQSAVNDSANKSANTTVPAITPGLKQTPAPANITNPEIILASTSKVPATLKSHKSETVLPIIKDSANKSANTTVHANTPGPKNTTVSINITNPEIIPAPTSKVPAKLKSHKSENVQSAVNDSANKSANTTVPANTPGSKKTPAPVNITNPEIILNPTSKVPASLKGHKSDTVLPAIKDSANKSANTTVPANTTGLKKTEPPVNITNAQIISASKVPAKDSANPVHTNISASKNTPAPANITSTEIVPAPAEATTKSNKSENVIESPLSSQTSTETTTVVKPPPAVAEVTGDVPPVVETPNEPVAETSLVAA